MEAGQWEMPWIRWRGRRYDEAHVVSPIAEMPESGRGFAQQFLGGVL